ncbi:MAG: sensor histidine kinase, partial [Gemmatimonadaceae bacterium]
ATPLVVTSDSAMNLGPMPDSGLIAQTREGKMPVKLSTDGTIIRNVALAPLEHEGRWVGAAGVATPLDDEEVIGLKGVSRSDVIVASAMRDVVTASTLDTALARAIVAAVPDGGDPSRARDIEVAGARYLVVRAPLADAGSAIFVRSVAQELQVLPTLRRTAGVAAAGAVILALALGAWMALRISRPVRQLAAAARALGAGRFDTELPDSRIAEVAAVAARFDEMRRVLQARLVELRESNEALQDRSVRLAALQSDLMQRERLAAAGRLVAQLAHEIRNPVASLRNCLEVVRRRVAHDAEGVAFVDLAINELLRMHELAEQMLDVSRPRPSAIARCAPVQAARDVVRLVTAGIPEQDLRVEIDGDPSLHAAIAGDALKQVLLNLVQNSREAAATNSAAGGTRVRISVVRSAGTISVAVDDNGPGVPPDRRDRVFDPFFSTKADLHGVGLGLFVAEGLVRSAGGRVVVGDAPGGGARFDIELPLAGPAPLATAGKADGNP